MEFLDTPGSVHSNKRTFIAVGGHREDALEGVRPITLKRRAVKIVLCFVLVCAAAVAFGVFALREHSRIAPAPSPRPLAPSSITDLLVMSPEQVAEVDLALMNLLCAKDLLGSEGLDIPVALRTLDGWVARVRSETNRHLYRVNDPRYSEHYQRSEARLRAEFIVQVLQEDCGVHYNTARIDDPDMRNSKDNFIHGMVISDNGGTCASMPVLYAAVAQRLGYPVKLVLAKQHVFCRWEDGRKRFNIDGATNGGVNFSDDAYYRTWPSAISDDEVARGEYLKSLSPTEELALFLRTRADCLFELKRFKKALDLNREAAQRMPQSAEIVKNLNLAQGMMEGKLVRRADGSYWPVALPPPPEPDTFGRVRWPTTRPSRPMPGEEFRGLGLDGPKVPTAHSVARRGDK